MNRLPGPLHLFLILSVLTGCNSLNFKEFHQIRSKIIDEQMVFHAKTPTTEDWVLSYHLLTFKPERTTQRFPLILAFHGTGDEGRKYLEVWKKEALGNRVFVLAPEITFINNEVFYQWLDRIIDRYPIDRKKIFLAGVSSGALTARWMMLERPSFWKGVIFVASPDDGWVEKLDLRNFPSLLFVHGGRDKQYSLRRISGLVESLRRSGVDAQLIADSKAGHEHRPEWNARIFEWIRRRIYS